MGRGRGGFSHQCARLQQNSSNVLVRPPAAPGNCSVSSGRILPPAFCTIAHEATAAPKHVRQRACVKSLDVYIFGLRLTSACVEERWVQACRTNHTLTRDCVAEMLCK